MRANIDAVFDDMISIATTTFEAFNEPLPWLHSTTNDKRSGSNTNNSHTIRTGSGGARDLRRQKTPNTSSSFSSLSSAVTSSKTIYTSATRHIFAKNIQIYRDPLQTSSPFGPVVLTAHESTGTTSGSCTLAEKLLVSVFRIAWKAWGEYTRLVQPFGRFGVAQLQIDTEFLKSILALLGVSDAQSIQELERLLMDVVANAMERSTSEYTLMEER